ncbi:hypothetical protein Tco_0437487, partial [Tanacetum coccineum]
NRHGFIAKMGPEVNIASNEVGQLNALIEQRKAEAKLADLEYWLTMAEEEIMEKQKQLK